MNYYVRSDICVLYTDPEDGEDRYGYSFRVVAELPDGRRFEHFHQEQAREDIAPPRLRRLLGRVQAARPNVEGRPGWRETYPAYGSAAFQEMEADMARIERAQDERDNRYELSGRGSF